LTYDEVAEMLVDRKVALREKYTSLVPHLEQLYSLYKTLHKVRQRRGSIDFDLPETKIIFDDKGKIDRVVPLERNDAHRLIEECMLAANICAGEYLQKSKLPAPYRVHAGPADAKLLALREFLFELGLTLSGGDSPKASDYAALLESVRERPDAHVIQTVMLRSQSQAVYSPDNIGHFALAYPTYTHFTSPIRRYPDLIVHRLIKAALKGKDRFWKKKDKTGEMALEYNTVKAYSEHCSMTGRRADEANWDVIKWLKTEFMMDKVGEEYDGVISGVTSFGLFVELKEIFVEGLVHVTELGNDYYHFEAGKHRMVGERTRHTYRLGDQVRVKVMRVDLDEARIDFGLVGQVPRQKAGRGKSDVSRSGEKKGKGKRTGKRKSESERKGGKTGKKKTGKKGGSKRSRRGKR
ncbi:MAG: VacB/RNase II family 3'-5' exoribonuclease, partial [Gammaproteobacteria bacterium]|nr:VacB/RNase II family 3'-5' exoribonuclease [Gammaproteobacteria bacterium]